MRIVVAITGATGAIYGIAVLEALKSLGIETHLILSAWALRTIELETDYSFRQVAELATVTYQPDDLTAGPASGSFSHQGMIIAPCSMKTLASIAHGYADNLISRAADVSIKEKRPLVLLARETPLSAIHLENMLKLSRLGVVVMPPIPSFYQRPATISDIIQQTAGRALDLLGIENSIFRRWNGME